MMELFKELGYNGKKGFGIKKIYFKKINTELFLVIDEEEGKKEGVLETLDFLYEYFSKANVTDVNFKNVKKVSFSIGEIKKIIEISVFNVPSSPLVFKERKGKIAIIFENNNKFYNFRKRWEKTFDSKIQIMGFSKSDFSFEVADKSSIIDSKIRKAEKVDVDEYENNTKGTHYGKKNYDYKDVVIKDIPTLEEGSEENIGVSFLGEIFKKNSKDLGEKTIFEFGITDYEDSIICKKFSSDDYLEDFEEGQKVYISGRVRYDDFINDTVVFIDKISLSSETKKIKKEKKYKGRKRFEFSIHTNFTASEGIPKIKEYKDKMEQKGIEKVAITDLETVQSFPDAEKTMEKNQVIYGTKFNVFSKKSERIYYGEKANRERDLVSIDVETTGFSSVFDDLIEIGAVKESKGEISKFNRLIKLSGRRELTKKIVDLTGITEKDLNEKGVDIKDALNDLYDFLGKKEDVVLIAHNAEFDMDFINLKSKKILGKEFDYDYIDTLSFAKVIMKDEMKRFNLGALTKKMGVNLENAHRATDDAEATLRVFKYMINKKEKKTYDIEKTFKNNSFMEIRFSGKKNLKIYEDLLKEEFFEVVEERKTEQKRGFKMEITVFVRDKSFLEGVYSKMKPTTFKVLEVYTKEKNILKNIYELNDILENETVSREFAVLPVLAKNQNGLKNLFKLVSQSYQNINNGKPMISDETIFGAKDVLVGSGNEGGLFKVFYEKGEEEGKKIMEKLDYIEISPVSKYASIVREFLDYYGIKKTLRKMVEIADELGKPIVATSSSFYIEKDDKRKWEFYVDSPKIGGGFHAKKGSFDLGEHHLFDTEELIEETKKLFPKRAEEFVLENPRIIAKGIKEVEIIKDGLFAPSDDFMTKRGIESVKKEFFNVLNASLKEKYEDKNGSYHPKIKERTKKEIESILGNGFEGIYYISYELVRKSNEDGYVVGSRGSVGSSFVAYLMGITEVNPLAPHYRCSNCNYVEFDSTAKSGYDLPKKECEVCKNTMDGDGQNIPFETFLGFKGDKVPDIDLNFSGEYQAKAHEFTRDIFGVEKAFRAGTISTIAEKNAIGVVKTFYEKRGISKRNAEIQREAKGIEGVKRTTGQHPGGIIIIPEKHDIEDFTPVQYPANKKGEWKTTHFDFNAIHDNLLKLDILGHDDPTTIKVLMEMLLKEKEPPFKKVQDIPLNDEKVLELFQTDEPLTNGIPEFGTPFVQEMLKETKPKNFDELVKISGLSHGTDVWLNNAKELVNGSVGEKIPFSDVIGCRDDIMVYLMEKGMKEYDAFEIMEFVRKGKPSKDKRRWKELKEKLKQEGIEGWYIWSLEKIKYMFPKAHACAYVLSALRIAWFKVYRPIYFYSAFFHVRGKNFDIETMSKNLNAINKKIEEIENDKKATDVEKNKIPTLKVAADAWKQNVKISAPDINVSLPNEFVVDLEKNSIIASFVSVDGLGDSVAKNIFEEREKNGLFKDWDDFKKRTKANKTHVEKLKQISGV